MSAITVCLFRFYGNAAVKRKVAQWRRILKPFENPGKQYDVAHPISENDDEYEEGFHRFQKGVEALLIHKCVEIFGIKLNPDPGRYIEYQGDFHFFCDRYSLSELRFLLLNALIPLDKDVVVEYFYDFENDFGYKFVANDYHFQGSVTGWISFAVNAQEVSSTLIKANEFSLSEKIWSTSILGNRLRTASRTSIVRSVLGVAFASNG